MLAGAVFIGSYVLGLSLKTNMHKVRGAWSACSRDEICVCVSLTRTLGIGEAEMRQPHSSGSVCCAWES